eukprot:934127_1
MAEPRADMAAADIRDENFDSIVKLKFPQMTSAMDIEHAKIIWKAMQSEHLPPHLKEIHLIISVAACGFVYDCEEEECDGKVVCIWKEPSYQERFYCMDCVDKYYEPDDDDDCAQEEEYANALQRIFEMKGTQNEYLFGEDI